MRFERRSWRESYKAVIVLENLLTHGPERVAEEFQGDRDVIKEMENFQLIDDRGYLISVVVDAALNEMSRLNIV